MTPPPAAPAPLTPPSVHVVIPTHLPRYLDVVLAGLAAQTRRADSITVSCDTDRGDIGGVIERCADAFGLRVAWVRRAHQGGERLCQVRNNAVRHLAHGLDIDINGEDAAARSHRIVVLDGDMLAPPHLIDAHLAVHASAPLTYAYRADLDERTSAMIAADDIHAGRGMPALTDAHREALARRQRRYRKHLRMRRLGLGAAHKPKLLGGHFACSLDLYLRLNGFDELYQGWGFKDDEFAYRAAKLGAGVALAVDTIPAFHLFHETRQPGAPMRELPSAERFARRASLPLIAEHGVRDSLPQPDVESTVFGASRG